MLIIPALRRLGQEDHDFEVSLNAGQDLVSKANNCPPHFNQPIIQTMVLKKKTKISKLPLN